jgi:hypothetical protein
MNELVEKMTSIAPTEDLQAFTVKMADFIKDRRDITAQAIEREHGWWNRLFPTRTMREYTRQNLTDFQATAEKERELFLVYMSAQIELARRAADSLITKKVLLYEGEISQTGMQIKASLTAFSQKKLNEMYAVFEKSTDEYIQRRNRQLVLLEKSRNDAFLFKRYKENLDRETEIFFSTKEELLDGFKQAVNGKIISFQPAVESSAGF